MRPNVSGYGTYLVISPKINEFGEIDEWSSISFNLIISDLSD